jgi:hypothetical protein
MYPLIDVLTPVCSSGMGTSMTCPALGSRQIIAPEPGVVRSSAGAVSGSGFAITQTSSSRAGSPPGGAFRTAEDVTDRDGAWLVPAH